MESVIKKEMESPKPEWGGLKGAHRKEGRTLKLRK